MDIAYATFAHGAPAIDFHNDANKRWQMKALVGTSNYVCTQAHAEGLYNMFSWPDATRSVVKLENIQQSDYSPESMQSVCEAFGQAMIEHIRRTAPYSAQDPTLYFIEGFTRQGTSATLAFAYKTRKDTPYRV